jgi:hypothetical protein
MIKNDNKKPWSVIHEESAMWARWIALYEAVNIIADTAEQKKQSFSSKLKPIAISKYIESTQDMYLRKILEQEYKFNFYFEDVKELENNLNTTY